MITVATNKTDATTENKDESKIVKMQSLLQNRALFEKVRRIMLSGERPVQMLNTASGKYCEIIVLELSGNRFHGNGNSDEMSWMGIYGDHVLIGDEKFQLDTEPTTELVDPGVKRLDLASALNSMMDFQMGSVFIAYTLDYDGVFFLVKRFLTDGECLCAISAHDGQCHDLYEGYCWIYDLKYRRYVYGEGGPLQNDPC